MYTFRLKMAIKIEIQISKANNQNITTAQNYYVKIEYNKRNDDNKVYLCDVN